MRMLGENPTPAEAAELADKTDRDGSGAIDRCSRRPSHPIPIPPTPLTSEPNLRR